MKGITYRTVSVPLLTILLLLGFLAAPTAEAGSLTGGNAIYVINGEEASFTFDPIIRKDGTLIPAEVVLALGLTIYADGKTIRVAREEVTATLTLGQTAAVVNGQDLILAPAPVRIVRQLFLPTGLLEELGFEVVSDNGFLQINDLLEGVAFTDELSENDYTAQLRRLTLHGTVRTDDGRLSLELELTYLTPEIAASHFFPSSFRQRVRYLNLLKTNSLVLVRALNHSGHSATLSPSSLMLVDLSTTKQYEVQAVYSHQGMINQKIAAGASKSSVLVFPKLPKQLNGITVFADTNGAALGTLPLE